MFYDNFLDEAHEMTRQTATRFAVDEIRPHVHKWEEAGEFPRKLYRKAAEAGLLGVGFDEDVGGSGGGAMSTVMVIEGLMQGTSMGIAAGLGSLGIALPPIVQSGDKNLIDQFARPAIAGELICGLAITEPGTGSDVAAVSTRAEHDGDHYVVNGAKMFITSGVRADFLTTLVRTGDDPHGGLSFLVIETDRDGVTRSAPLKKHGWWGSDTAEIGFDDVRVPITNLVGAEGAGFVMLMQNFQNERLALAAYGVATAELTLDESLRYAEQRKAFGRPIKNFQVNRHKLVDMKTNITSAKTLVYQVAHRTDDGQYLIEEVSMAKNHASRVAVDVCYDAVQLHGGMGLCARPSSNA